VIGEAGRGGAVRQTKIVSEFASTHDCSGRADLTPFGEHGGASNLENGPRGEGAFLIKVVVDGAVEGGEFLQTSHLTKAKHRPFASSERLMGILHPVVQPASDLALFDRAQGFECSAL
jgi:hypothetical protein